MRHADADVFEDIELPRLLTRAGARRIGMSDTLIRSRRRTGRWREIAPDVFLTRPGCTRSDEVRAATYAGGIRSMITGAEGVRLHGVRPRAVPGQIVVLVPTSCGRRHTDAIRWRRTDRLPSPAVVNGVRVAPIERAVADHALEVANLDDVRALVAEAVQRARANADAILAEYDAGPRNGSRNLRLALEEMLAGARSAPEGKAYRALRRAGIEGFRQNVEVMAGRKRFVVDFLFDDLRAVIEIDSREFHFGEREWQATLHRDQLLQAAGYVVLHVTPKQLRDEDAFVRLVLDWLRSLRLRGTQS